MKGFTLVELIVVVAFLGGLFLVIALLIAGILFGRKAYNAIPEPPAAHVLDVGGVE